MLSVTHLNEMAAIAAEVSHPARYESELFRVIDGIVGAEVAFFKRSGAAGPVVRGLDAAWLAEGERSLFDCRHEMDDVLAAARRQGGVAVDLDVLGIRGSLGIPNSFVPSAGAKDSHKRPCAQCSPPPGPLPEPRWRERAELAARSVRRVRRPAPAA